MASITVLKENVPAGPFTRAEVAEKLRTGEFTPESLAFVEGLAQWTPLKDVLARVDGAAPITPSVPAVPAYSYAATMQPPGHLVYAGFWLRFAAIFIDGLILSPLALISVGLNLVSMSSNDQNVKVGIAIFCVFYAILAMVVRWPYFALQEAGTHQATFGKRLMGIYVTDAPGNRISFGRATGRFFGKILSGLILGIGYMMAGWTPRKQALHDMLADTLVVRK